MLRTKTALCTAIVVSYATAQKESLGESSPVAEAFRVAALKSAPKQTRKSVRMLDRVLNGG